MLTVRAERPARTGDWELLAAERPTGLFSRQLVLGDNLDLERLEAHYDNGVLQPDGPGRGEGQAPQGRDHPWVVGRDQSAISA